jgi:hypothetical protein
MIHAVIFLNYKFLEKAEFLEKIARKYASKKSSRFRKDILLEEYA